MDNITLNNQMVLMRKDFKKAKVHVISKLVRQAKMHRNKKGSESQKQKHHSRAERLIEEVDIIKDLKPDGIFKFLLSLHESPKPIEKMHSESLQERAYTRLGNIPFIKQKMEQIRKQVASFDYARSKKDSVTAIRISSKLEKAKSTVEGESNVTPQKESLPKLFPTADAPSDDIENTNAQQIQKKKALPPDTNQQTEVNAVPANLPEASLHDEEIDSASSEMDDILPAQETKDEVDWLSVSSHSSGDDACSDSDFFQDNETDTRPVDIGSITHTDNITDVLKNMGSGFIDSENEINFEEKFDSDGSSKDAFFLDFVASKPNKQSSIDNANQSRTNAKRGYLKSTFVTSLSSHKTTKNQKHKNEPQDDPDDFSEKPKKRKNRLGQRARQKLYGSTKDMKPRKKDLRRKKLPGKRGADKTKGRGKEKQRKKEFAEKRESGVAVENLHPSWQASQARKQQLQIQSFQGKRIKFDDSD